MTTVRQLEKLYNAGAYDRLKTDLMTHRPDFLVHRVGESAIPALAMAIIRLDELGQAQAPFAATLIRQLIGRQSADGGWIDPATTSLCIRALMAGNGSGLSIDRGLNYLKTMQKEDGLWPAEPFRRLASGPMTSAIVLNHLGMSDRFRQTVRFEQAIDWFIDHANELDPEAARLWKAVGPRCQSRGRRLHEPALLWS